MSYNWNVNAQISTAADASGELADIACRGLSLSEAIHTLVTAVPPSLWDETQIIYGYNRQMSFAEAQAAFHSPDFPKEAAREAQSETEH